MATPDDRILDLRRRKEEATLGGGKERIEQQHAKGKLTARERRQRGIQGTKHPLNRGEKS